MTTLTHELLTRLEAAHRGQLSEEDEQKLKEDLEELPGGVQAATEFRQIWRAMQSLQADEQRARFQEWEADWQGQRDAELVEWYLTDQLSAENRQRVEQRRAEDQDFARLIMEQERLLTSFKAAKDKDFRDQLNQWDQSAEKASEAPKPPKLIMVNWQRFAAVAAAVILLMVVGSFWEAHINNSDQNLVEKYYRLPPTGNRMGADEVLEEAVYLDAFTEAHQAMQNEDYSRARVLFEKLSTAVPPANFSDDDVSYYQDNLDWNLVLSLLGQGQKGPVFEQRLDVILASPEHAYFASAERLKADLEESWWW